MQRARTAFTLLELLVAIVIVMLLVVIVAVALRSVQAAAGRTESMGALRNMALAYNSYSGENRMQLMPGYVDTHQVVSLGLIAKRPDGTVLGQAAGFQCDSSSYVWRLAPYLDDAWLTLFNDSPTGTVSKFQAEVDCCIYGPGSLGTPCDSGCPTDPQGASERPSFGMNSIFVGGDNYHGGNYVIDRNPWQPADPSEPIIAATRLSEVKFPGRVIVFGPAALAGPEQAGENMYDEPDLGFCELRPPFTILVDDGTDSTENDRWVAQQWYVDLTGVKVVQGAFLDSDRGAGLPIDRSGHRGMIPVANLDGSAEIVSLRDDLAGDMRRWDPREVGRRRVHEDEGPP